MGLLLRLFLCCALRVLRCFFLVCLLLFSSRGESMFAELKALSLVRRFEMAKMLLSSVDIQGQ